jgi:AcrR family transcriptional regulator
MKAKSDLLATRHRKPSSSEQGSSVPVVAELTPKKRKATTRMPSSERRAQILDKAFDFFSEYGLTAQTRALADACGVSQRLLYSVFPNKASLINAVYEKNIAGPFKAIWLEQLRDRRLPLAMRLQVFYEEYYEKLLTRGWLRLFLYSSLAEVEFAPTYISDIIRRLLEAIAEEAAHEAGVELPSDRAMLQELGWVLHGNISHLAIRRHVYRDQTDVGVPKVIAMHVQAFLSAVPLICRDFAETPKP